MRAPAAACLVSLALAGCFAPEIQAGQYRCGPGGLCPAGFHCASDGTCQPGGLAYGPDASRDAPADGRDPKDGPPPDAAGDDQWPTDRLGGEPPSGDGPADRADGPTDRGDGPADAGDGGGRRCDPLAPFGPPLPVAGLNSAGNERHVFVTPDGTTAFFDSSRSSTGTTDLNLWVARRSHSGQDFGPPVLLGGVNSDADDQAPSLTADGLTLYFDSNRPGGAGGRDLYRARRASLADDFGPPENVAELNETSDELTPNISPDGETLYFTSSRRDGMGDLYAARLQPDGTFGPPQLLAELATDLLESSPFLTDGGLTIYFTSARDPTLGKTDVWVAVRPSIDQPFGELTHLDTISSAGEEFGPSVSLDGCRIYFASFANMTDFDIFSASR